MSATVRSLMRSSHVCGSRRAIVTPTRRRSISWMAFEQPNPALYMPPPRAPQSQDTKQTTTTQPTRKAGESIIPPATTITPPKTTIVAGGSQEVSTSSKTAKPSLQAARPHLPLTQVRNYGPECDFQRLMLPCTLLRIPDHPATWPCEPDEEIEEEIEEIEPKFPKRDKPKKEETKVDEKKKKEEN
ncbi:hypothetical protein F5B20DRAFT_575113 [Whalleya microplaca]|nr:hypothetical protein F5B20DRAFT_575113 [Whalleya microplaca]